MECGQSLKGQHDAVTWFTESQLRSVIRNGVVPEWFHGIISRKIAEELLMPKPPGYFLIRVSETRIGYTLSYRADDRCRHFMIDALEDGHYIILGENLRHRSLQDLVDFHRRTPIMPYTEVLTIPCGQSSDDKTDYAELLFPQRNPKPNASLPPNNSQQHNRSRLVSHEETAPPALPFRPNNLIGHAVPPPSSQPNRLYPSLNQEFSHMTTPLPAPPVPLSRKRNTTGNPPSTQPPEVPARNCVPLPKPNQACTRTVSAPQNPSTTSGTESTLGSNAQAARNQEGKPSVVSNLKNLKKKFYKKRSTSQENMYTEINMEGREETEYQVITGEQASDDAAFSFSQPDVKLTDRTLPLEYLPPPPFAPGYCSP